MTQEEINRIRAEAGANPIEYAGVKSLSERLNLPTDDEINADGIDEGNFFERVGGKFKELGERVTTAVKQGATPTKSVGGDIKQLGRTVLRGVGAVAEGAFVPIVEAPGIKQVFDFIGEKIADTEIAQKLVSIVEANPEKAQDVMDIVNVLTLGVGKTVTKPVSESIGKGITKTGEKLVESATIKTAQQGESFIRKLVRPVQTKAIKEAQVARTTETGKVIFKRSVIEPTQLETRIEKSIATVPGISEKNTAQQNFNVIKKFNSTEAENLITELKKNDFIFPKKELKSRLQTTKEILSENPNLVGDNQKIADKLISKFEKILEETQAKGSSLLQARKDYDAWVIKQKGTSVFDPKTENAFSITNREIRQTANDFLEEKAVNVNVKESLAKQSDLFRALDNIKPKAAIEADTAIGRAFQNMANAVGIKNKLVQQIAAVAGIGGLGAAATFAPTAAIAGGLGFLAYKGGQLVLKPGVRKGLGELLKMAGESVSESDLIILRALLQQEGQQSEE